jgi:hypothetical protein
MYDQYGFFIFHTDQAQIKSAWFFLQNNLRLRNALRIQEGKQCKTEKNKKKMVYHAKGMPLSKNLSNLQKECSGCSAKL